MLTLLLNNFVRKRNDNIILSQPSTPKVYNAVELFNNTIERIKT
jgi:hypothetical protein